ncbi:MAG: DUF488 family protein [Polyangiaceae bacterium]
MERAYAEPSTGHGKRYLVDRLWPRGVKRDALHIEGWLQDVAPSEKLRQWFGHDPKRWVAFKTRYLAELHANKEALAPLVAAVAHGPVTLVFGAKDEERNNAVVLRAYLLGTPERS